MKQLNNLLTVLLCLLLKSAAASNFTRGRQIPLYADIVDMQYTFQQKYLIVAYHHNVSVFNGVTAVHLSDVDVGRNQSIICMSVSNDYSMLALGFIDGVAKTFTLENDTYTEDQTFDMESESEVNSLCFTVNQAHLVMGLQSSRIYLGNVSSGEITTSLGFDENPIFTVACHPQDSQIFAVGGGIDQIGRLAQYTINGQTIAMDSQFTPSNNTSTLYAFYSPLGDYILRATTNGTVQRYNTTTYNRINSLKTQADDPLHKVQLSEDEHFLVTVNNSYVLVYESTNYLDLFELAPAQSFQTDAKSFALTPTGGNVFYKEVGINEGQVLDYCTEGQFYDQASKTCVACENNCSLCLNQSSNCYECQPAFYLHKSACQPCEDGCLECVSDNNCTMCNESQQFKPEPVNGTCMCAEGYYKDNASCTACMPGCLRCDNATICISCDSEHKKVQGECKCDDRKYDDQGKCKNCTIGCFQCDNGTSCNKCDEENHFIQSNDSCVCDEASHYQLNETECVCEDGFFSDNVTDTCMPCGLGCLRCLSEVQCEECKEGLTDDEGICKCPSGQYIDPDNETCANCSQVIEYCQQCDNKTNCTVCQPGTHRVPKNGTCPCEDGYYDSDPLCLQCQTPGCLTCINNSTCSKCDDEAGWQLDNETELCVCKGHFTRVEDLCVQCEIGCLKCQNDSVCQECDASENFVSDANNSCICNQSYFLNDSSCLKCMAGCKSCDDEQTCYQCDANGHFEQVNGTCECVSGFIISRSVCKSCSEIHRNCKLCSINKCTQCTKSVFHIQKGQCVCNSSQYVSKDNCKNCNQGCLACESEDNCSSCTSDYHLDEDMCYKNGLSALVIVLIVLGVIAVAGAVFVLIKCIKKKRAPLLDDYNDLDS